jgi:tetratricopeptide (TPR) repeat protein
MALDKHYVQSGIIHKIVQRQASGEIDPELNAAILGDTCQYRGLNNLDIYRNESTVGNWMIYPEKFLGLAQEYNTRGDTAKALAWGERSAEIFPYYWRGWVYVADFNIALGDTVKGMQVLEEAETVLREVVEQNPDERLYELSYGMLLERMARTEEAKEHIINAYFLNGSDGLAFQSLLLFCRDHGYNDIAVRAARKWLEYYPSDNMAMQIVAAGGVR